MKIEFSLRIPGNHTTLEPIEYDAVPREGEGVILKGGDTVHYVHSVMHDTARNIVCVLLRP